MKIKPILSLFITVLCLLGISAFFINQPTETGGIWSNQQQIMLLDFEEKTLLKTIRAEKVAAQLVTDNGVTNGSQALKLAFERDEKSPGIEYKPDTPIDASQFNNFCLVFDATNLTEVYSVQLYVTVFNDNGEHIRRSAVVPVGQTKNYFFELSGEYVNKETGLRDDPNPWRQESVQMKVIGLKYEIDFSKISSIHFRIAHPIAEKSLILDNVRLVESPAIAKDYLVGIIDKYGQNAKMDFAEKITSNEELKNLADAELQQLETEGTMAGRGKFGGWSDGPKMEGTGFFRTKKMGEKWALIDPEGYLFFSTGLANVRMANTTSFTGVDYKNDKVRYRDPEDVTPEDSRGMVKLDKEVTETAYIAYPERHKMFLDLPTYDDSLANNYSYRREQFIGPFAHGETFSHYQANLERRYGEPTEDAHLEKWLDVTLDRFLNWGFTSFGNWVDTNFYKINRMPYFANGWIIGDFKTVKSGMDYWGPMPDVFDPEFTRRVGVTVKVVAEEVQDNPWCIGIFIDNEKSWGMPGSVKTEYGIVLHALELEAKNSPIKAEFITLLKEKYNDIAALNVSWKTEIDNWATLEKGIDYKNKATFSDEMVADFSMLLEAYATQYFQTVHDALTEVLPNHLYMGCRFASWGMGQEVRDAAKKYVDVFSYNYYEEAIGVKDWKFLEDIDRPSVIGEFHMGSSDSGLFHPGLIHATDQQDRARMYKKYMQTVIDNPYFVGAHWFQYLDSPTSGRAHDGENYNVGFVRITDVPYTPMVKAAKELNKNLYERRFGN